MDTVMESAKVDYLVFLIVFGSLLVFRSFVGKK